MEVATEELLFFSAGILAIVIALPFLLSTGSSFSQSFSGQATALQIANNFHLDTPILYNKITAQITNFGSPIRLHVNITANGNVYFSKIMTFNTGINNINLEALPSSISSETEQIKIYGLTGELLGTYDVQVINSNLVSITGIGAGTKILINQQPINFTPINGNLTFAIPTGAYNFTEYSPYYYYQSEEKISNSNYNLALPGATTLATNQITVEQMLPTGKTESLSLAVLNINHNSSIAKSNTAGVASFEYSTSSNSIYINASCPLNSCAGEGSNYVSNNYTSISKFYSAIPSTIVLYPKFMTNVNLQMTCKVITSSKQQIEYVVPLTITNSQSTATGTYQQMVNISESDYSSYINYSGNTANFELMYPNNTHIPAWIQANDSGKLITFAKLNNIPAGSSTTVDLVFFNKSYNTLSSSGSSGIGEASELSSSYAQYDDGPYVFNNYWNFAGTTLPNGFNQGAVKGSSITVNNGLTISGNGTTDGSTYIATTSPIFNNNEILEGYINQGSENTVGERGLLSITTINNAEPAWDNSGGAGDTVAGWSAGRNDYEYIQSETVLNGQATYLNYIGVTSNWYVYSVALSSANGITTFVNHGSISPPSSTTANIPSAPLYVNLGVNNTGTPGAVFNLEYQWILIRTYPPNGIMPSVSFGAILKGNQNLTTTSTLSAPTSGVINFISQTNQSLDVYKSVGPSGSSTLWLPAGTYNVEATSFTNLVNSTSFTSSTNDQTATITFYSEQPCS